MLKVLHTADWHLGQSLCGFDRDFEHSCFLEWLLDQLQTRRPDVLLLSGDVFDSINPSAQAQRRLYNFLAQSHSAVPSLQIVIVAGNHDPASRLEAPERLLDSLNMTVVGTVRRDDEGEIDVCRFLVPLRDSAGNVAGIVLAVPFLRPADVPLIPDADDPYLDGIRELYRRTTEAALRMRTDRFPQTALLAMGHCHLQGACESPDSERRLVVGGAEAVSIATFDPQISYVALGHLHRAQTFDDGRVRYSGSPIPLSFAESDYRHQILQLTLDGTDLLNVEGVPVPRRVQLLQIPRGRPGTVDELLPRLDALNPDSSLATDQQPFLEVRIREEGPDPTRRTRIEQALEGQAVRLASIKLERPNSPHMPNADDVPVDDASLRDVRPLDVLVNAWQEKYDHEPDPEVIQAFREILLQELDT